MPKFEAQVLGGFVFNQDGGDVKGLHAERLMLFLSYLLVNYNITPTRKQISFLFWADSTEEQARTNLRNILHHLRKVLPELDSILEVDTQFIRLRSDADLSLDVRSFKTALAFAKTSKSDVEQIAHLQEAVSQYRGELLPGFYDDWILAAREECHQAYVNALFELSKLHEDARQYVDAIQAVNRLLRVDALNESAYLQLMRLYALSDDRAGALQVFHACSTVLMRELGVEPSQDIKRLHEQLVRSEEIPDGESGKSQAREAYRLIGRKQEWGRLREAWTSIQKGKAGMFVISGEAGIGKSRLSNELLQWMKRQGVVTAFAQCYPMEDTLSFAPVVAWLRMPEIQAELGTLAPLWKKELARLLPELESGVGEAGEKKWQKQRLFEAVAKGLLGSGKPRLLVLDDAQWSDQETLEFVQYLMRYAAGSPLMILLTERVEELGEDHPLQTLRAAVSARKQLDEIELKPLSKTELGLLAREVMSSDLSESKQDELFAETEGNPFFVVETLRSSEAGVVPQSLRTVLSQRLSQLSASARELVGVASAIGREFGYALLARSSQMDENQLVQALDELWGRRILQTREDGTYSFTHGKLLDAAYEALTQPRKLLFHRRIAEALLSGSQVEDAIVARHFERAGEHQKAFEAYLKAAVSARKVFANRDAISHLEKALGLLKERSGNSQNEKLVEITEMLGDLYEVTSDHVRAQEKYEQTLEIINTSDLLGRARVLGKCAKVLGNLKEYEKSKLLFVQAEKELDVPPGEENIEWWQTWLKVQFDRIWMIHDSYNIAGMQEVFEVVRPVVERLGETDMLAEYYFLLPTLYFNSNGYQADEKIIEYSTLALELSLKGTDLELQSRTQFGYGFVQLLIGNIELAIKHLEEGLRLSTQIGYLDQQTYCITYLAVAHRRAGNLDECRRYSEQMLEISEREGQGSFTASAFANLGWLAWKQNDFAKAKTLSKKAVGLWHPRYAFHWHGLWTLIDISLRSHKVDEAVENVRRLRAPSQHVLSKELDDLMVDIIGQVDKGNISNSESLLKQAVAWVKEHHYL